MPTYSAEHIVKPGDWLKVTHPASPGVKPKVVFVRIKSIDKDLISNPNNTAATNNTDTFKLDIINNLTQKRNLNWHNCYSFGNGVESNRIGDTFNTMTITPGVKASTIFEDYKEEHRKYGLIYSGIYNDNSGINNLNQFVQAEKITKDVNPSYGSIQKLHARDTDLITLCEDKVLRIMANKDAVYNADGNSQLTATENVLGQTVPFVGEYGISKNPESFVSEAYRSYFTDKQRGAVMRLSRDGLTPISDHGMRDWFRDNLSTSRVNLLGDDILTSESNWDLYSSSNVKIENGQAIIGYYNNDINSNKYGKVARLRKENVFEVGKKYRIYIETGVHSGFTKETTGEKRQLFLSWTEEVGSARGAMKSIGGTDQDNAVIYREFIAPGKHLTIHQYQVNGRHDFDVNNNTTIEPEEMNLSGYTTLGGTLQTIRDWVNSERIAAGAPDSNSNGIPDNNDYNNQNWFYGAIVPITRLEIEEVKEEPVLIGSYDDRQDEYNLTIHSSNPTTVTFREDVKGWVSFKSFTPENALSCANDYFTIKNGMLYQHHVQGINNNTFYGNYTNSSLNVILNNTPGSIKSFHTLDYEGSDSRVEGIRNINVDSVIYTGSSTQPDGKYFYFTNEEWNTLLEIIKPDSGVLSNGGLWATSQIDIKQYRNNILIKTGPIKIWNDPLGGGIHGRWNASAGYGQRGDWQVGDVITTEQQEKTVNHFNSMPKDGWYISDFTTDKDKGSLPEFIEKEGKWFNYIKGVETDGNAHYVDEYTNFGDFDIQGIGIIDEIDGNDITFTDAINSSLQKGDCLYYEKPSEVLGPELVVNGRFDDDSDGWGGQGARDFTTNPGSVIIGDNTATYSAISQDDILTIGKEYEIKFEILDTSNPGGSWPYLSINNNDGNATYSDNYHYIANDFGSFIYKWKANVTKLELYASGQPVYAKTIEIDNVSVKEFMTGDVLGFTRLEANNLQKVGIVTSLSNNTVTVDSSGIVPSEQDYVLFVKNQVVNKTSLKGYYANVKFENNSKRDAEIFSVGSEITESSK